MTAKRRLAHALLLPTKASSPGAETSGSTRTRSRRRQEGSSLCTALPICARFAGRRACRSAVRTSSWPARGRALPGAEHPSEEGPGARRRLLPDAGLQPLGGTRASHLLPLGGRKRRPGEPHQPARSAPLARRAHGLRPRPRQGARCAPVAPGAVVISSGGMKKRMTKSVPSRTRVTVSLPSDLVRRLDRQSRVQGASRSGVAERWLRAGERQASLLSLEQELESYYSRPGGAGDSELAAALGRAARVTAAQGEPGRRARRRSSR